MSESITISSIDPQDQQVTINFTDNNPSTLVQYVISYYKNTTGTKDVQQVYTKATTAIVLGLTNGATYTFEVFKYLLNNTFIQTSKSSSIPFGVPAAPVVSLTAVSSEYVLSWPEPNENGKDITTYSVNFYDSVADASGNDVLNTIYSFPVDASGNLFGSSGNASVVTANNAYVNPYGTPTVTYVAGTYNFNTKLTSADGEKFNAFATNVAGNSDVSNLVTNVPTILPYSVSNLQSFVTGNGTETVANSDVYLTWDYTDPSGSSLPILGYIVSFVDDLGNIVTNITTDKYYTIDHSGNASNPNMSISNGTQYEFSVSGMNILGVSTQSDALATPITTASVPTGLQLDHSGNALGLSWTASSNNGGTTITNYNIYDGSGVKITDVSGNVTSNVFTGLTNGQTYTYSVDAENAAGTSAKSGEVSEYPSAVPDAPVLAVAGHTISSIDLSWTTPVDNGDDISLYDVYRNGLSTALASVAAPTTTYTDSTLLNGSNGLNVSVSNSSNWSGPATTGSGYTMFSFDDDTRSANLGANSFTLGNISYNIIRFSDNAWIQFGSGSSYPMASFPGFLSKPGISGPWDDFDGTRPGKSMGYKVTSNQFIIIYDTEEWGGSTNAVQSKITLNLDNHTSPGAVRIDFGTIQSEDGMIGVSYGTNSTPTTSNTIDFTTLTGTQTFEYPNIPAQLFTTGLNALQNKSIIFNKNNNYRYTVSAVNRDGNSALSNIVAEKSSAVPSAPVLSVAGHGATSIDLSWNVPANNGDTITDYKLYRDGSTTALATVLAGTETYTDSGLTVGQSYSYVVKAENRDGESAGSNSVTEYPSAVPDAPVLDSFTHGNTTMQLDWYAPTNNGALITNYKVYKNGAWVADVSGNILTYTVTGLTNGTTYNFKVLAVNRDGNGALFGIYGVYPSTTPGVPTSVAVANGNLQLTVSWAAPVSNGGSSIVGYSIYRDGTGNKIADVSGNVLSYVDSSLTNGQSYTYYVTAENRDGLGVLQSAGVAGVPSTTPSIVQNYQHIITGTSLILYWSAPANTGGITYEYAVQLYDASGNFVQTGVSPVPNSIIAGPPVRLIYPSSVTLVQFENLDISKVHTSIIYAKNAVNGAGPSTTNNNMTAQVPAQVTNLAAVRSAGSTINNITVTWDYTSNLTVTQFLLLWGNTVDFNTGFLNFVIVPSTGIGSYSYQLTDLDNPIVIYVYSMNTIGINGPTSVNNI